MAYCYYVGCLAAMLFLVLSQCAQGRVISLLEEDDGVCLNARGASFKSALGDPGMQDPRVRVALESWNFCNKAGGEAYASMPSPRQADCADLVLNNETGSVDVLQRVSLQDNKLKSGDSFPQGSFTDYEDPDEYAVEKELYLASLCEIDSGTSSPWHFWMIMLKNGNVDVNSGLCPASASAAAKIMSRPFKKTIKSKASFPCFGQGCMNHPMIFHNWSEPQMPCTSFTDGGNCNNGTKQGALSGSFYGTYDLEHSLLEDGADSKSYFSVTWEKNDKTGSWQFNHVLKVNHKYPWLMLYLRADATKGLSGGYPWETRGMMVEVPKSPNFKVQLTLNVIKGGGPQSQFYLLDIGGCWKNDGSQCDGNTSSDVTRYSEMIINPSTPNWCRPNDLSQCPPYHVDARTGRRVYRNDTKNFPYEAYHLYCVPSNARHAEVPYRVCDPYSNPQPQELMQLLPHPEWAVHGYPSSKGHGWQDGSTTWTLDVGALSQRLYFYQDPNTPPAVRKWPSIDVGTEIYISSQEEVAEWVVSDFDVLIPQSG